MIKLGKVVRVPHNGRGLLMIEGRQYWFSLKDIWTSETPPKPGLTVEVRFDQAGQILAVSSLSGRQLAEEKVPEEVDTPKAVVMRIFRPRTWLPRLRSASKE